MARREEHHTGPWIGPLLLLIAAALLDQTAIPVLLAGHCPTRFLAAAVILIAFLRGPLPGVMAGWIGALLLHALTPEPLAMATFRLGMAAFLAGHLRETTILGFRLLNALLLLACLLLEDLIAGLLAWGIVGAPLDLNIIGALLTVLTLAWSMHAINRIITGRHIRPPGVTAIT